MIYDLGMRNMRVDLDKTSVRDILVELGMHFLVHMGAWNSILGVRKYGQDIRSDL